MKIKTLNIFMPLIGVLIGSFITFYAQYYILKSEKEYDFRINEINKKTKLYERTVEIYQIILTELNSYILSNKSTIPITNKFSVTMNKNVLFFNDTIKQKIEKTIKNGYWNINKNQMDDIMQDMVKEIRKDKNVLGLLSN